ncbi:hypothetical protein Droror1_Dr00018274 [Drosera rotundifolia]
MATHATEMRLSDVTRYCEMVINPLPLERMVTVLQGARRNFVMDAETLTLFATLTEESSGTGDFPVVALQNMAQEESVYEMKQQQAFDWRSEDLGIERLWSLELA